MPASTVRLRPGHASPKSVTLRAVPGDAGGSIVVSGALVYPALSLAGESTVDVAAAGSLTYPPLQITGTAAVSVSASGSLAFPPLTLAGSASVAVTAAGSLSLPALALTGSIAVNVGAAGALALPALVVAGTVTVDVQAAGTVVLPPLGLAGSVAVSVAVSGGLDLPALELVGEVTVEAGEVLVSGNLTLPVLDLSSISFSGPLTAWPCAPGTPLSAQYDGFMRDLLEGTLEATELLQVTEGGYASLGYRAAAVICDGNSITRGFGATAALAYPAQLQVLLLGQATQIINLGVDGKATQELIDDFAAKVLPHMQPGAELVFFEQRNSFALGVSVASEKTLVQTYVAQAQAAGFFVWICTPPGTTDLHAAKIEEYSIWLRSNHAFADGFIDLNACPELNPPGDPAYYSFDGVHLNAGGYAVLAAKVYAEIG